MHVELIPGRYVIAVSGGVDSVALLDLARQLPGVKLVVAHYDHGIRTDSASDRLLVQRLAATHKLPFVYDIGNLGPDTSEDTARKARYAFLQKVCTASNARSIVTAHHQDDVLETAIFNVLRGTGRKGLTALHSRGQIIRPLLHIPKYELVQYATRHSLEWREDSTNGETKYARNYIRSNIMPRLGVSGRQQLLEIVTSMHGVNQAIDSQLTTYLHTQTVSGHLDRHYFIMLSHAEAKEAIAAWLRAHGQRSFDTPKLERLVVAAKTGKSGTVADVSRGMIMIIGKYSLALRRG
jgi:tRNA(Ile)-lysidine synthetase-like protein